jgi:hypothetical protein
VAAVEFALVAPLLVFVLFAIIEAGFGFYSQQATTIAISDAARVGSIARDDPTADRQILEVLADRVDGVRGTEVVRIVTFEATSPGDAPPAACISGTGAAGCNVYDGTVLDNPAGASCSGWCPSERRTGDLLGVWLQADFDGLSGMTPMTLEIEDSAIVAIEPVIIE